MSVGVDVALFCLVVAAPAACGLPVEALPDANAPSQVSRAPDATPDLAPIETVAWKALSFGDGAVGMPQAMSGIVDSQGRLIIWGRDFPTDQRGESRAALWTSTDGATWRREDFAPVGLAVGEDASIIRIAGGPKGLVAIGSVCCNPDSARSWFSSDGLQWSPVELPGAGGILQRQFVGVAATANGFVLAGIGPALWRSSDGVTWAQVDPGGAFAGATLNDLKVDGDRLVAVGRIDRPSGESTAWEPAIWASADDGATWLRLGGAGRVIAAADDGQFNSVAPFSEGLLAFGTVGSHKAHAACSATDHCSWFDDAAWLSTSGEAWEPLPLLFASADDTVQRPRLLEYRVLANARTGLITVGEDSLGGPAAWISSEGRAWERLQGASLPRDAIVNGVVVRGDQVLAVGTRTNAANRDYGVIWLGRLGAAP